MYYVTSVDGDVSRIGSLPKSTHVVEVRLASFARSVCEERDVTARSVSACLRSGADVDGGPRAVPFGWRAIW